MLVFGWGENLKELGQAETRECENCHNVETWVVVEKSKKASVYFVPVAKWSKEYFYICPVCHCGAKLQSREQAQDILLEAFEDRESRRLHNR